MMGFTAEGWQFFALYTAAALTLCTRSPYTVSHPNGNGFLRVSVE